MNANRLWISLTLLGALLLAGCASRARVGELRSESQSVELGAGEPVRVEIDMGAGDLEVSGGAEKLLEADFTYNVARLEPKVEITNGTLIIRQPEVKGLPALVGITGFRNEWDLRLNDGVPMDLRVNMGAGSADLQLAGLSLTGLDIDLGAGKNTIDLSGDWARDLDATIDTGAGEISIRLPSEVGVRVEVEAGLGSIEDSGLTQDGDVYTNAAYGMSDVTLRVDLEAGVGQINLEVEEQTQEDPGSAMISGWVWHDLCDSGQDGEPAIAETPEGCVEDVSALGKYHAEWTYPEVEQGVSGTTVTVYPGEYRGMVNFGWDYQFQP